MSNAGLGEDPLDGRDADPLDLVVSVHDPCQWVWQRLPI
jgi:hypothetical protein